MVLVVRKKRETSLSLLKRFNRRVQQSGNIVKVKSMKHKERNKSELKKKKEALSRVRRHATMRELYKLGKVDFSRN